MTKTDDTFYTRFKTWAVPNIGTDSSATAAANVAYNPTKWLRVLVRNIAQAIDVTLALSNQALTQVPPGDDTFLLPAGQSEVFVLAPGQKLFASSAGSGAQVSVAISVALPTEIPIQSGHAS